MRKMVATKPPGSGKPTPKGMKKSGFGPFKKKKPAAMLPAGEMGMRAKRVKDFEMKNGDQSF